MKGGVKYRNRNLQKLIIIYIVFGFTCNNNNNNRLELKQQFPTYTVKQFNIIIDVLGGWSREVDLAMRELFGTRGGDVLLRMQKAVISHSLNIARTFKVLT